MTTNIRFQDRDELLEEIKDVNEIVALRRTIIELEKQIIDLRQLIESHK